MGEPAPLISEEVLDALGEQQSLSYSDQRRRAFMLFAQRKVRTNTPIMLHVVTDPDRFDWRPHLLAWTGGVSDGEAAGLLNTFVDDGLMRTAPGGGGWLLTANGFRLIDELQRGGARTRQAFVAMWFDDEMKDAWRLGLAPAIRDAGYDPFRIDALEHNGKIDDAIVAEIKKSRFLVADFTCGGKPVDGAFQPNPRGGVYYEAGLAHGLGMEVVFTCRSDRMAYLHFDTRQFAHIVWETPDDLRFALYNRIAATIGEAPGAPGRGRGALAPAPTAAD